MAMRSYDPILIRMLAAGRSEVDAGKAAGVCERTVRRRLKDPEFRAALEEYKAAQQSGPADQCLVHVGVAISTLVDVVTNGNDRDRLSAAKVLLDRAPAPIAPPAPPPMDPAETMAKVRRKLKDMQTTEPDNPDNPDEPDAG